MQAALREVRRQLSYIRLATQMAEGGDQENNSCKKSTYKERFSFDDPLHRRSASRSTIYRARKRAKLARQEQKGGSTEDASNHSAIVQEDHNMVVGDDDQNGSDHETDVNAGRRDVVNSKSDSDDSDGSLCDFYDFSDGESVSDDEPALQRIMPCTTDEPQRLYEGASLTTSTSSLLISKYKLRLNLTGEALSDLLRLLKLHCPSPNTVPASPYLFKRFRELKYPVTYHYFCNTCLSSIDGPATATECTNPGCAQDFTLGDGKSYFLELPIEKQLCKILERKVPKC